MSTIAVARKGSRVAIGADTLIKDRGIKIPSSYLVDDSKIVEVEGSFIAHVGDGSWAHVVVSALDALEEEPDLSSTAAIYETMRELHPVLKEDYFLRGQEEDEDSFESSEHVFLIANRHGIFGVFPTRSIFEYSKFMALGAGCEFAMGAMFAAYDSSAAAADVVRRGLEAACEFDEDTGAPIEVLEVELGG